MRLLCRIGFAMLMVAMLMTLDIHLAYAAECALDETPTSTEQHNSEASYSDEANDGLIENEQNKDDAIATAIGQSESAVMPCADTTPTSLWNLSAGKYQAQIINLAAARTTNTARYFTTGNGVITINFHFTPTGSSSDSSRIMTIKLYRRSGETDSWRIVETRRVTFSTYTTDTMYFYNLDPNMQYYIAFINSSGATPGLSMDINGYASIGQEP